MLYSVFLEILHMSFTAGIVIIVVILARCMLRRAPRIFSYLLWSVVLFRFLCPVSFSSQVSVLQFAGRVGTTAGSTEALRDIEQHPSFVHQEDLGDVSAKIMAEPVQSHTGSIYQTAVWIGASVWLAGIAVMLGLSILSLIRLRRRLVGAVRLRDNIYLADYVESPFVFGVVRPRIYLPAVLSDNEQAYIILHEQIHMKRGDHLVKILAFAALTLHWFNPLAWLAFYLSGKDMEMSCDEAVMKEMGSSIRAEYSASLLNLATGRNHFAGTFPNFGEGDTGSRIKHVMRYKKPTVAIVMIAAAVLAAVFVSAGSNPKKLDADTDSQPEGISADNAGKQNLGSASRMEKNMGAGDTGEQDAGPAGRMEKSMGAGNSGEQNTGPDGRTEDGTAAATGKQKISLDSQVESMRAADADPSEPIKELWTQKFGLDSNYAHKMQCGLLMEITDSTVEVDLVEYIEREDTQRVKELGLTEYDMPDGYYIHNPDTDTVDWKLDSHTQYLFVDWERNYTEEDADWFVLTKDREVFASYIQSYVDAGSKLPIFFYVEDGVVRLIVEKPFA